MSKIGSVYRLRLRGGTESVAGCAREGLGTPRKEHAIKRRTIVRRVVVKSTDFAAKFHRLVLVIFRDKWRHFFGATFRDFRIRVDAGESE